MLLSKNLTNYILVTTIVTIIGVIAANHLGKVWGKKDDGRITIDEFAGILITFIFLKLNWLILLIGFILFRFFDIAKPLFIRSTEKAPGGFGVMFDDILSGIYANLCLRILIWIIK
jgi:phosphatidylglycerophosphatase A